MYYFFLIILTLYEQASGNLVSRKKEHENPTIDTRSHHRAGFNMLDYESECALDFSELTHPSELFGHSKSKRHALLLWSSYV